jgi:hypothetical protein
VVKEPLVIDPFPNSGNASMFINDPRIDPMLEPGKERYKDLKPSTDFVLATYRDWPYLFIRASQDISRTTELQLDYGKVCVYTFEKLT